MELKQYYSGTKKRSGDSGVEPDRNLLSKEQRDQRISLFLRDFDQQAKDHLQVMKQDLEALLQTAEKAFRVELLTRPLVLRRMRRKDLIHLKEEEAAATVVAAATANDCSMGEGPNPKLLRTGSKRVKVTTIVEYKDAKEESGPKTKKTPQKILKTKSLASLASALKGKQGTSRSVCSTPNMRNPNKACTLQRSASASKYIPLGSKRHPQRGFLNGTSASERTFGVAVRSASMPHEKAVPFVNIPLADGQTLCLANDDLKNLNREMLNDDTVQHIHTLVNQLTVLCGKATVKPS
ncbi:borealin-2-like [Sphaerodactylus townsendi]|uniref:borealin-2-like n=1 Tax=Sphaerodactylus townsendi TaxID=933632 RepID=UPI0020269F0E|nr:borealin-2-like [Sphaerodactylus townsendi]